MSIFQISFSFFFFSLHELGAQFVNTFQQMQTKGIPTECMPQSGAPFSKNAWLFPLVVVT